MLNFLNKYVMYEYDDVLKMCVNLVETTKWGTFVKQDDLFSVFIYSKKGITLISVTFFKSDTLDELEAKFVGVKAVCNCLTKKYIENDTKTA